MDKAAITKNATPAHHRLLVKNQTTKATRAAGTNTKSKRTTKMIDLLSHSEPQCLDSLGKANADYESGAHSRLGYPGTHARLM